MGQIEADAWENYKNLSENANLNVAIMIFCSFHSRPILMETPQNIDLYYEERQSPFHSKGSGTDYYNIDLQSMRTIEDFLNENLNIKSHLLSDNLDVDFYENLLNNEKFYINHDRRSDYQDKSMGWNWIHLEDL